jgi:imidazole glycerol-phosphate synthase subunit HisH
MTRRITVGIVDYGAGNLASVARALTGLGYRCRTSREHATLAAADVLVLPGVGAFPAAMAALHRHGLVEFIQGQARKAQPIVGICLGMQLLAHSSHEQGFTTGLGLIPGQVLPLQSRTGAAWHIGWNQIEANGNDPLLQASDGESLYFNHAFVFDPPAEYRTAVARLAREDAAANDSFTVAVRRQHIVGLQFHPEKSQHAGRAMLRQVIEGLAA